MMQNGTTKNQTVWTALPVGQSSPGVIFVSNKSTTLPLGDLRVLENFVQISLATTASTIEEDTEKSKESEDHTLLKDVDRELGNEDYHYEGFHGPRRDCCFFNDVSSAPIALQKLHQRFHSATGLSAKEIHVEEYIPQVGNVDGVSQDYSIVSIFAIHNGKEYSHREMEESFVAEFAYIPSEEYMEPTDESILFQAWNKPPDGHLMAWKLNTEDDWADVLFPRGSCIVRRGAFLNEWRCTRFLCMPNRLCNQVPRIRVIRFLRLPDPNRPCVRHIDAYFGYVPSLEQNETPNRSVDYAAMPPLKDLLTIVVTTSPIPSNPNTELLETAMQTFLHAGEEFAYRCPKVIMCDGVREGETVSRKHATTKQAMRSGIVTSEQAENYAKYKRKIRRLVECAPPLSIFRNASVIELEERHGFGFSLRQAIRDHVKTRYVCVVQHDRTFLRKTPVFETVKAMWGHANIKYIGFNMKSNLTYRDTFQTKYGNRKDHQQTFDDMILQLSELRLSSVDYGPNSKTFESLQNTARGRKILGWAKSYAESSHGRHISQTAQSNEEEGKYCQLSLIPTLFWFDNIHICETNHYRDFIFNDTFRQVARGGFVEDKVSPMLKKTCERLGLKEGFMRYGCYLLDDHSGMAFTGHFDGGTFKSHRAKKL